MGFKVYCQHEDYAMRVSFYIFEEMTDGKRKICKSMDSMKFEVVKPGCVVDPTFTITGPFVKPFLKAFANMLNEQGIKADGEPVLENELTATRCHLEDMRTLVFK